MYLIPIYFMSRWLKGWIFRPSIVCVINITDSFGVWLYYKKGSLEFMYQTHSHLISLHTSDIFLQEIWRKEKCRLKCPAPDLIKDASLLLPLFLPIPPFFLFPYSHRYTPAGKVSETKCAFTAHMEDTHMHRVESTHSER